MLQETVGLGQLGDDKKMNDCHGSCTSYCVGSCLSMCGEGCYSGCSGCAGSTGYIGNEIAVTHCSGSVNVPISNKTKQRIEALCNDIQCYCNLCHVDTYDDHIQNMIDQFCIDIEELNENPVNDEIGVTYEER